MSEGNRAKTALAALIREQVRHLPYALLYPATVLKDWGDMHLDLNPEAPFNELLPPMTRIPLKVGVPGLTVKIKAGARVWVAFGGAEADAPFCIVIDSAIPERLALKTGTGVELTIDEQRGATSDDGVGTAPKTFIELKHPSGHSARVDHKDISVKHKTGQTLTMLENGDIQVDAPKDINVSASANVSVTAGGNASVEAGGVASVNGSQVVLAGGGPPVARVGDDIQVTVAYGSSAGVHTGKIIKGSPKTVSG